MALAINDILQIKMFTDYLGEQCLNVFHYRLDSFEPLVGYIDILNQFVTLYDNSVHPVQLASAVIDTCEITNLTNGVDIANKLYNGAGDVSGNNMPSFTAWGFQLYRTNRITRHGWKRIVGVPEEWTIGNNADPTRLAALGTAASMLGSPVIKSGTLDEDFTMTPVIVGRTRVAGKYELDLTKINPVQSAAYIRLTTQNTRKP